MSVRSTNYYNLLNIPEITENLYGKEARAKIEKTNYLHFLFHLAKKYKTVLLPGIGFGAPKWYLRISLANLASTDYKLISKNIKLCIFDFIKKSKRLM
jgi:aspartate 4-decarboxylase